MNALLMKNRYAFNKKTSLFLHREVFVLLQVAKIFSSRGFV